MYYSLYHSSMKWLRGGDWCNDSNGVSDWHDDNEHLAKLIGYYCDS